MTGRARRLAASLATVGLLVAVGWAAASTAAASCAGGPREALFEADSVVRGTVVDVRHGFAQLQVEEIWKGPATRPQIWVRTGETAPGVASSADITLTVGARYVLGADAGYRTNACRVLDADAADRLSLRPAATTRPDPAAGATGAPLTLSTPAPVAGHDPLPLSVGLTVGGLALAALLLAGLMRTRRRGWPTMGG